jgi:hypothetical protein
MLADLGAKETISDDYLKVEFTAMRRAMEESASERHADLVERSQTITAALSHSEQLRHEAVSNIYLILKDLQARIEPTDNNVEASIFNCWTCFCLYNSMSDMHRSSTGCYFNQRFSASR